MDVLQAGQALTRGLDEQGRPCHYLDGQPVGAGTLLELQVAPRSSLFPMQEVWPAVRYEPQLVPQLDGSVELVALGLVAVATGGEPTQVPLRLPEDALLRWSEGVRAPARRLSRDEAIRLEDPAEGIERSAAALRAAYIATGSGLERSGRYLMRMDAGFEIEADLLRRLARQGGPVWPHDLRFLEDLARRLEERVAEARRYAGHYEMSAAARVALQQEGGRLLIEAGWVRDLCARLLS